MTAEAVMTQHPTEESLAAFSDGRLSGDEQLRILEHLADCVECRDIVVALDEIKEAAEYRDPLASLDEVKGDGTVTPITETERVASNVIPFPSPMKWVAAAAVAAGIVGVLFLPPVREKIDEERTGGMSAVVKAYGQLSLRPVEPRLSELPHKGLKPTYRSGEPTFQDELLSLKAEAGRLAEDKNRSWKEDRALAYAQLLTGERDAAIVTMERVAKSQPANPQILNDLAAMYLERSRLTGNPREAQRALDQLERASQLSPSHMIAFNRALALEYAGHRAAAVRAWREYVKAEPASPWKQEAEKHLSDLLETQSG